MAYDISHNHRPPLYLPALILLALVILQIGEIKKAESTGYDSMAQSECAKINQAENLYFTKIKAYNEIQLKSIG